MASPLSVIVDDNSDQFSYSGADWKVSSLVQWYGGTTRSPDPDVGFASQPGTLSLVFEGTSVRFYGNTPAPPLSQNILVTIDGGPSYNTSYGDSSPPSYGQWYQSPELNDGHHNITIDRIDGTSIDFAVVTVGPDTRLAGKRIIVDDDDPSVQYSGNWRRDTSKYNAGDLPDGFPFRNGTHQTSTVGDSLTFRFSGTSTALYGILSWSNLGSLSVTYTLDGASLSESYTVTTSSPEFMNNIGDASNFLFFANDTLAPGEHTLVVHITRCINQSFIIDYITYSPSFSAGSRLPGATTTSTTQPSTTAAGTSHVNPITSNNNVQEPGWKQTPINAIIGGCVGGLFFVALLAFIVIWLRKRHRRKAHKYLGSHMFADYYKHYNESTRPLMGRNSESSPFMETKLTPVRNTFTDSPTPSPNTRQNSRDTITPFTLDHSYSYSQIPAHRGSAAEFKLERVEEENQRRLWESRRPSRPAIWTQLLPQTSHNVDTDSREAPNTAQPLESPEFFACQGERPSTAVSRTDSPGTSAQSVSPLRYTNAATRPSTVSVATQPLSAITRDRVVSPFTSSLSRSPEEYTNSPARPSLVSLATTERDRTDANSRQRSREGIPPLRYTGGAPGLSYERRTRSDGEPAIHRNRDARILGPRMPNSDQRIRPMRRGTSEDPSTGNLATFQPIYVMPSTRLRSASVTDFDPFVERHEGITQERSRQAGRPAGYHARVALATQNRNRAPSQDTERRNRAFTDPHRPVEMRLTPNRNTFSDSPSTTGAPSSGFAPHPRLTSIMDNHLRSQPRDVPISAIRNDFEEGDESENREADPPTYDSL
ncbi:hypothetical protein B0H34DRAFT_799024 [Crassisporium funariophilum]|nr:hypothetical protein B0H34DRAFT_799024 [Crassisporium funariophilum]